MKIEVRAEIHPTEDPSKLGDIVERTFPGISISLSENLIRGEASDVEALERFKRQLRSQGIRDSARRLMREGLEENSLKFLLNRQALTMDKISFTDGESPLGPIEVKIESKDLDELIGYLAPSAKDRGMINYFDRTLET